MCMEGDFIAPKEDERRAAIQLLMLDYDGTYLWRLRRESSSRWTIKASVNSSFFLLSRTIQYYPRCFRTIRSHCSKTYRLVFQIVPSPENNLLKLPMKVGITRAKVGRNEPKIFTAALQSRKLL